MATFVMATRIDSQALSSPHTLEDLEKEAQVRIKRDCPNVEWVQNLAVCGPYDYIDIFHAPDLETAQMVSMIVRSFGRAHTELWPATEWKHFKQAIDRTST